MFHVIHCYGDTVEEDEVGGTCSTRMRAENYGYSLSQKR